MGRCSHVAAVPLDDADLVAFTPCGHWWMYPVCADPGPIHDLARFNLGIVCSFCLAEWHAATHAQARRTAARVH
jgi:hypothetical protein